MQTLSVLIVEDEPGDAGLIRWQLADGEDDGIHYALSFSTDMESTLAYLDDNQEALPQIILLDLNLPDSTGVQTVKTVREAAPDVPIVVLTGLNDSRAAAGSLHAGAEDYLVKGSDGESVRRAIRYAMLRHERDEDARLAETVFNITDSGILITDARGRILRANPAFTRITGYHLDEIEGKRPEFLKSGRHGPEFYKTLWQDLSEKGYWEGEIWNRRKTGEEYVEWLRISAVKRSDGVLSRYVGVFNDITERKQAEEQLTFQATHDLLTGLPNRFLFLDRLETNLNLARRNNHRTALLYVDLDGFKAINDTLGHPAGDALLKESAARMKAVVRSTDTVARLAGDEFVIILPECQTPEDAARIAEKLVATLAAPFSLKEGEARVSASIGVALSPDDGTTAEVLLKAADTAMYRAKHGGKNSFVFSSSPPQ